jgi:hypothetical protein
LRGAVAHGKRAPDSANYSGSSIVSPPRIRFGYATSQSQKIAQPGWKWATQKSVCLLNEPRAPLYTHNGEKKQKINARFAGGVRKNCHAGLSINVLNKKNRWQYV